MLKSPRRKKDEKTTSDFCMAVAAFLPYEIGRETNSAAEIYGFCFEIYEKKPQ